MSKPNRSQLSALALGIAVTCALSLSAVLHAQEYDSEAPKIQPKPEPPKPLEAPTPVKSLADPKAAIPIEVKAGAYGTWMQQGVKTFKTGRKVCVFRRCEKINWAEERCVEVFAPCALKHAITDRASYDLMSETAETDSYPILIPTTGLKPLTQVTSAQRDCIAQQRDAIDRVLADSQRVDAIKQDLGIRTIRISLEDNSGKVVPDKTLKYGPNGNTTGTLALRTLINSDGECLFTNTQQLETEFNAWLDPEREPEIKGPSAEAKAKRPQISLQ